MQTSVYGKPLNAGMSDELSTANTWATYTATPLMQETFETTS